MTHHTTTQCCIKNIFSPSWTNCPPYLTNKTCFWLVAYTKPLELLYPRVLQKMVRIVWFLTFSQLFLLTIFTILAQSSTQYLLWDISSHRPILDPPLTLSPSSCSIEHGTAKNGKNWLIFDFFTVISTDNFYNSHAVIHPTFAVGYLIPQTDFSPAAFTTPSCCSIQQGGATKWWELVGFWLFTVRYMHHF